MNFSQTLEDVQYLEYVRTHGSIVPLEIANVTVIRKSTGNVQNNGGMITFQSNSTYTNTGVRSSVNTVRTESVRSDASEEELKVVFRRLGYGDTNISRTFLGFDTYTWTVQFLEESLPFSPLFISSVLLNTGEVTVSWNKIQNASALCCLVPEHIILYNEIFNISTFSISQLSSMEDIRTACSMISGVNITDVTVSKIIRPSEGCSFFCEFSTSISTVFSKVKIFSTVSSPDQVYPSPNVSILQIIKGTVPGVQRVHIGGVEKLKDFFSLQLESKVSGPINIDITDEDFEIELTKSFHLSNVRIRTVRMSGMYYDYRIWDVQYVSYPGDLPLMLCVPNISSLPQRDIFCKIEKKVIPTSIPLSGFFTINSGKESRILGFNSTAEEMKNAIEYLTFLTVNVTRTNVEFNSGSHWIITFLADLGSDSNALSLTVNSHFNKNKILLGTNSTVTLTEIQKESSLRGTFTLSYDGKVSVPIPTDVSTIELSDILLQSFNNTIKRINILQENITNGNKFQITFIDPMGDISLLQPDDRNVEGVNASVRTYEKIKGVGSVFGDFTLRSIDAVRTTVLSTVSTASDVRTALMSLPLIGDVTVRKTSESFSISVPINSLPSTSFPLVSLGFVSHSWFVTFSTYGYPTNAGTVDLLISDSIYDPNNAYRVEVKRIQAGCCDVAFSYNGKDFSEKLVGILLDDVSLITGVNPNNGDTMGGIKVTVKGIGFHSIYDKAICLFGSLPSPAVIIDEMELYCIAPPHPVGKVVISVQLSPSSTISKSQQFFLFLSPLSILNLSPTVGHIDKKSLFVLFTSPLGIPSENMKKNENENENEYDDINEIKYDNDNKSW